MAGSKIPHPKQFGGKLDFTEEGSQLGVFFSKEKARSFSMAVLEAGGSPKMVGSMNQMYSLPKMYDDWYTYCVRY